MSRLPSLKAPEIIRALERGGFFVHHVKGSHYYLRHPDRPGVQVAIFPHRRELPQARSAGSSRPPASAKRSFAIFSNRPRKYSPSTCLESGLVAEVEADFPGKRPIVLDLGLSAAAGYVHLVMALPGEIDATGRVSTVEPAGDGAEYELAKSLVVEGDIGGLQHVQKIVVPQLHLDDPPLAGHRARCRARHVGTSRSLGRNGVCIAANS